MSAIQQVLLAYGAPVSAAILRLWLQMEGSNGGTSFTDSSSRARAVANASGLVTTSTTRFKEGSSSARFAGGANEFLTLTSDANSPLTGDFCIHCWFWVDAVIPSGSKAIFSMLAGAGIAAEIYVGSTGTLRLYDGSTVRISGTQPVAGGDWHHACLERRSGTMYLYLDDHEDGTWASSAIVGASSGAKEVVGGYDPAASQDKLTGNVDDLYVYDGAFFNGSPGASYRKNDWRYVRTLTATNTASGTTLAASAFALATGESVFVWVRHETGSTTVSVSDTAGNTYTALSAANTSNGAYGQWFYCLNATGHASNVVTVTWAGAQSYRYSTIVVYNKASAAFDTSRTDTSAAATSITSGGFTTAAAGLVLAGHVAYNNDSSAAPSAPCFRLSSLTYSSVSQRMTDAALSGATVTVSGANTTRVLALASFI